jgi:uncharacterized membrane protein
VHAAAFRLGQPVLDLDAVQAERIRQIAAQLSTSKPSTAWSRVGMAVLQMIGGVIIAAAVIAFIAVRLI